MLNQSEAERHIVLDVVILHHITDRKQTLPLLPLGIRPHRRLLSLHIALLVNQRILVVEETCEHLDAPRLRHGVLVLADELQHLVLLVGEPREVPHTHEHIKRFRVVPIEEEVIGDRHTLQHCLRLQLRHFIIDVDQEYLEGASGIKLLFAPVPERNGGAPNGWDGGVFEQDEAVSAESISR